MEIIQRELRVFSVKLSVFNLAVFPLRKSVLAYYYAHVTSILKYGVVRWGNRSDVRKIFIVLSYPRREY